MKVEELLQILQEIISRDPKTKNKEVEIMLSEPAIGPAAATGTQLCYQGFDWNSGKILICPKENLIRETYAESVFSLKCNIAYKIEKCVDMNTMKDTEGLSYIIGRVVSEPVIDKKKGCAKFKYLYDENGNTFSLNDVLKISSIKQINRSFDEKSRKETMTIITDSLAIFLSEINCPK